MMRLTPSLALLLLAAPAWAQTPPTVAAPAASPTARPARAAGPGMAPLPLPAGTRVISLDQAERMLLERNLNVIAAQRGVDAVRAQRLVASSLPPPSVTVGNNFAEFNSTQSNNRIEGARFISPSNNIALGLTVLIETGGKRTLRTRLAEQNIAVAEAQVLDALRGQFFQLRQAFIAALAARANLEVALANRGSLDRTEALLRRQLQDGALPEGDLLRFQASRLPFEADVTNAAQNYAAAVAQVAVVLAMDAAAFSAPATRNATTAALPPVALDVRGRFDAMPTPGATREELAEAVQNRADVVAAARAATAGAANTSLAEAQRWRDVTLNGGWSRSRLSQDLPSASQPLNATNQFTFSLSVPLFTNQIVTGQVGTAAGQQAQLEAQARAALLQGRADFATAWAAYEQSRALLRLYTGGALNRAELAYRSAEQAYLAGGRSLLDVLDALRTLNATRVGANNARAAYLTALAQLEFATGVSGVAARL
ncbi:TolC family protein [Sediminicoccus rosea]|uniref:TolC family protein n=1 Tax=Sediminicoccus rosea TaxID=1225128 RepID=A0ABZ0PCU8_9PROT|nr:TolC family protein [Sediminicoccus rosea]WPB83524.1 TolC family protein [Sediminicoccus rosea]